jgi:hypothetical protein
MFTLSYILILNLLSNYSFLIHIFYFKKINSILKYVRDYKHLGLHPRCKEFFYGSHCGPQTLSLTYFPFKSQQLDMSFIFYKKNIALYFLLINGSALALFLKKTIYFYKKQMT